MRHILLLTMLGLAGMAQSSEPATVSSVKSVFLTPMPGGLEQYLALHLTQRGVATVVTDSTKADAVFTDRVGDDFKQTLAEMDNKPVQSGKAGEVQFARPNMRPLARARGTVFLVNRQTGDVIWSTLEQPKSSSINDLNAAAKRIVERLEKERAKKE